ncbi:hypothetical protein A3K73_00385 [Candidatus Pacearchaeota archaeon RBG_13_36_9]|nr:MAG: hypothetical protein A3K73_00385 [Candidatus Pacearchaeota archaeon RBG_13_36_9]
MAEKCKTCHKEFNSGIWIAPQFADEEVLLFCSEKCRKEYKKMKLKRIKSGYSGYHKKLIESIKKGRSINPFFSKEDLDERGE